MALTKVGSGVIQADAVGSAAIADDAVGIANLGATGTASSSTFLRGDNAWAAAGEDNTPSFSAYNPLQQTLTSSGYDLVAATTELYDNGSCYDTTAKRFTVPADEGGKYVVWARMQGYNSGNVNESNEFGLYLFLNGVENQVLVHKDSGKFTKSGENFCSLFDLSATDYLELKIYSVATSNTTVLLAGISGNSWGSFKLAGV